VDELAADGRSRNSEPPSSPVVDRSFWFGVLWAVAIELAIGGLVYVLVRFG
jgi:hypothetical protein